MKISQINFNLHGSRFASQKITLNQIPQNINFQSQNQDTFSKTHRFTNDDALRLLRTELQECMNSRELDIYIKKIVEMCKRLEIEPKNLPINKEHPGNLKDYQRQQMTFLVKEDAISI